METKLNQTDAQGLRQGLWEYYWNNGNLMEKRSYFDGKQNGYWELYFLNGNLHCKGSWLDGKQIGTWEEYNEDGILEEVTYHH